VNGHELARGASHWHEAINLVIVSFTIDYSTFNIHHSHTVIHIHILVSLVGLFVSCGFSYSFHCLAFRERYEKSKSTHMTQPWRECNCPANLVCLPRNRSWCP